MKYIDDDSKKLYWWNRNYFFVGTILIVLINIVIYAFEDSGWGYPRVGNGYLMGSWYTVLDFDNLVQSFLNGFSHSNWQHVLLNMLCFLICGAWLERRKGSICIVLMVLVMNAVTGAFISGNHLNVNYHGYSGVNYGFYAYAIIDYCFLFTCKQSRTKINIISGAILLGLIYFAACFSGGTAKVTFEWYPYDFMHNMGHYSSFLGGAILGLTVQLAKLVAVKERKEGR